MYDANKCQSEKVQDRLSRLDKTAEMFMKNPLEERAKREKRNITKSYRRKLRSQGWPA